MSLEEPSERAVSGRDNQHREAEPDEVRHLDPDVILDIPVLKIEELHLEVEDLLARITVQAELADFFKINVGVDAHLDKAKLSIKGVDAQATLKVRLEGILNAIDRALDTIDRQPDVITRSGGGSRDAGVPAAGELEAGTPQEAKAPEAPNAGNDSSDEDVPATDAARNRARQLGLRLSGVKGTGAGGRILVRDLKKAAGS